MPTSLTLTPRKIYKQDLNLTDNPSAAPVTEYVLGVGNVQLNPLDAVLYSSFGQYASDAAAAAGGVGVGYFYYNTSASALKVRMS
jgi:hypothetical protein